MILSQGYFDRMYRGSADPWSLATRWYEARKYALSLALLPRADYDRAFEPGCSIGVLTAMLAPRCKQLVSWDTADPAVEQARLRAPTAEVEQRAIPDEWPDGTFDLLVFSEILYYFSDGDLARVLDSAVASLRPGGALLAVHWRRPVPEYPLSGDEAHDALARTGLSRLIEHSEEDFRAEVYVNGEPISVATAEGLT